MSNPPFVGDLNDVSLKAVNQGVLSQDIGAVGGLVYQVTITTGGTTGNVIVTFSNTSSGSLPPNQYATVPAGTTAGVYTIIGNDSSSIQIRPSLDFDGTVDDVSVKQVFNRLLLSVFGNGTVGKLYAWDGTNNTLSDLVALSPTAKNRFSTLGGSEFLTNNVNGMFSSTDGLTWVNGTSNDCIDSGDAKPSLVFRYQQRLVAGGDPTFPDRVFFSSVIDPNASPFITWNTDPSTGDWIDVNPDDGGNVTGFSENSTFLLVFKDTGMYRLDVLNKTVDPDNIFDVGAASQEGIVLCMGVTYFFSGNGVYRTNGGYPEQISRAGVQDIIESLSPSVWSSVAGGTDGLNVYFSLGTIVVDEGTESRRVIDNCVLKFSPRDQSWSVHSYRGEKNYRFLTQFTDDNGPLMRGSYIVTATSFGVVDTINLGMTDSGSAIDFFLETQDIDFSSSSGYGMRSHLKGISDEMAVYVDNGVTSQLKGRVNGGSLFPIIGNLNNRVNVIQDINLQGNFFNFRWFGASDGTPPVLDGFYIEKIQDLGMQTSVGQIQPTS